MERQLDSPSSYVWIDGGSKSSHYPVPVQRLGRLNRPAQDNTIGEALKVLNKKNQLRDQHTVIYPEQSKVQEMNFLNNRVEELAKQLNTTEDEVIKAGISLIELAIQAKKEGKKFGVVEGNKALITEVVGF